MDIQGTVLAAVDGAGNPVEFSWRQNAAIGMWALQGNGASSSADGKFTDRQDRNILMSVLSLLAAKMQYV